MIKSNFNSMNIMCKAKYLNSEKSYIKNKNSSQSPFVKVAKRKIISPIDTLNLDEGCKTDGIG